MMKIYTYLVMVDGHGFATDFREDVAWLISQAKSTGSVEQWHDEQATYFPVPQHEFLAWSSEPKSPNTFTKRRARS